MKLRIYDILALMVSATIAIAAAGCSTTSRLEDGEVLYTGVKKITYNEPEGEEVIESVEDQIFSTINVKPNNSLYSPYVRHPFPLGLWVYNHWDNTAESGYTRNLWLNLCSFPT